MNKKEIKKFNILLNNIIKICKDSDPKKINKKIFIKKISAILNKINNLSISCKDCKFSFDNPFDQLFCEKGKTGKILCKEFKEEIK